jgi:hypothetical protein
VTSVLTAALPGCRAALSNFIAVRPSVTLYYIQIIFIHAITYVLFVVKELATWQASH